MPEEKKLSKGEQTRQAIIESAYTLFLSKGYHATSMRQIADGAELAPGGIYNHFTGKEEIFAAVLDAYHPYHTIVPALDAVEGDTLDAFVRDAARRIRQETEGAPTKLMPLMFVELVEFQGRHVGHIAERMFPAFMNFFQKFSQHGGNLRAVPLPVMLRTFMILMIGFLLTEMVIKNVPVFKDMDLNWFDGMVDIYLHGIVEKE